MIDKGVLAKCPRDGSTVEILAWHEKVWGKANYKSFRHCTGVWAGWIFQDSGNYILDDDRDIRTKKVLGWRSHERKN